MKVIKPGTKGEPWVGKKVTCPDCDCTFEFEQDDKLKLVPDSRDGDYFEVPCPECRATITIAAELFGRSIVS